MMPKIRLMLALYDSAYSSDDGNYWRQRHDDLPSTLLDRAYYQHLAGAVGHRAADGVANEFGGFFSVDDQWCCWYQFVAAGRDLRGRPGRYLIACAFAERNKLRGRDASVLHHDARWRNWIDSLQRAQSHVAVSLDLLLDCEDVSVDLVQLRSLLRNRASNFDWPNQISAALSLCGQLPEAVGWHASWPTGPDNSSVSITIDKDPCRSGGPDDGHDLQPVTAQRTNPNGSVPRMLSNAGTWLAVAALAGIVLALAMVVVVWFQSRMEPSQLVSGSDARHAPIDEPMSAGHLTSVPMRGTEFIEPKQNLPDRNSLQRVSDVAIAFAVGGIVGACSTWLLVGRNIARTPKR